MDKLISVVIPTFNRRRLTDRAIESVVSSSPALLEVVVVDDCGSITYSYNALANRSGVEVRIVRLLENAGAGMARKAGVEYARGKFIAFLDSDDFYDRGWMDYVVTELLASNVAKEQRLIISGITVGARPAGKAVRWLLAKMPKPLRLVACRTVAVLFNPFYTPSIVLHREICKFRDGLRHCEDYYSAALSVFLADMILLPSVVSCHLGRKPNSSGGESSAKEKMYRGEMEVRRAMLRDSRIPVHYRLQVPIGMSYQLARTAVKRIVVWIRPRG